MDEAKIIKKLNQICDAICEEFGYYEREDIIEIVTDQFSAYADLSDPDYKEFSDMDYDEILDFCNNVFTSDYYGR